MDELLVTNSTDETQQLGFDFAKQLQGGEVLALYGELGSGKTTFTQGLAKGLGITGRIISPTFIIMRTYEIKNTSHHAALRNFFHVDLYRIENKHDIEGLGLMELLGKKENIVVIEWPEKLGTLLPKNAIQLHFSYENDERRKLVIKK